MSDDEKVKRPCYRCMRPECKQYKKWIHVPRGNVYRAADRHDREYHPPDSKKNDERGGQ
jgi:hypothetical protein